MPQLAMVMQAIQQDKWMACITIHSSCWMTLSWIKESVCIGLVNASYVVAL